MPFRKENFESMASQTGFSEEEIKSLWKNFHEIAPNGMLTLDLFKKNLNIMNVPRADHLAH